MPAGTPLPGASAARAGASAPGGAGPAALSPVEDIEALLPSLPRDINTAWGELGALWKLPASAGDPCQGASAQQLQCYHSDSLTVPLLRQLARPGILKLQSGSAAPVHALLVGLGEQSAVLRVAGSEHRVRLTSLGQLWRGDFATYWRPPPGYSPNLRTGSTGPMVQQLASQLSQLDAMPAPGPTQPQLFDAALKARVRAFQRAHGLEPDGQPGPMTLMQIGSATGVDGPRLQTDQR